MSIKANTIGAAAIALLLSLSLSTSVQAEETKYSVDKWLGKAIAKNHSTMGMRHATLKARELWDEEMNRDYKRLMNALKGGRRAALLKAQTAWLAFRDAELEANVLLIANKRGSMWPLLADENALNLVRTRALQLKAYARHAAVQIEKPEPSSAN